MKSVTGQSRGDKILYMDVLRAWACVSVIVIHVCAYYVEMDVAGMDYLIGNAFCSVVRAAVPLFVMISGALMLNEDYNCTTEKLKRMIKNRLLFFVIWSAIYAAAFEVLLPKIKGGEGSAEAFLQSLMSGSYHLWFIPMLIGLYLILPLLRLWVRKENKRYVEYFLRLSFIFAFALPFLTEKLSDLFPLASCLYGLTDNLHLQYVAGYTGYYVLGWYLRNFEVRRPKLWYMVGILGLLVTFAGTQAFSLYKGEDRNFYSVFSVNIACYAAGTFLLAKRLLQGRAHKQGAANRAVQLICRNSMGIYAVHPAVIQILFGTLGVGNAALMIPLVSLISFAASLMASVILRKLPIAKDYMV